MRYSLPVFLLGNLDAVGDVAAQRLYGVINAVAAANPDNAAPSTRGPAKASPATIAMGLARNIK